jgi:hypothetical protein
MSCPSKGYGCECCSTLEAVLLTMQAMPSRQAIEHWEKILIEAYDAGADANHPDHYDHKPDDEYPNWEQIKAADGWYKAERSERVEKLLSKWFPYRYDPAN